MPARKTRARRTKSSANPRDRAITAAVTLAAERGWLRVSLGDIAAAAKLSLPQLQAEFSSKAAVLAGFLARVDGAMLATLPARERGDSARDRLFSVIMHRLDVLRPHRRAVVAFATAVVVEPGTACALAVAQRRSLAWMLEAAGISSAGVRGAVRMHGLRLVMAGAMWVWSHDESPDLARTMAHVDRQLRRAEQLKELLEPLRRPRYGER